jgi:hypothetical protein
VCFISPSVVIIRKMLFLRSTLIDAGLDIGHAQTATIKKGCREY